MSRLSELLGSSTRANIIEALALSKKPLSAYRISKMYNMNIAKVYLEIKKLVKVKLVSPSKGRIGLEYTLLDKDLRVLALNLSPRTVSYDEWSSREARAERFRKGLAKIPEFSLGKQMDVLYAKPTRMPGELDTLAILARRKFDKKYRKLGDREYARI